MIHLLIRWYGRKPDGQPDYEDEHHGTIVGDTAELCSQQLKRLREDHDLSRYTRMEIAEIY